MLNKKISSFASKKKYQKYQQIGSIQDGVSFTRSIFEPNGVIVRHMVKRAIEKATTAVNAPTPKIFASRGIHITAGRISNPSADLKQVDPFKDHAYLLEVSCGNHLCNDKICLYPCPGKLDISILGTLTSSTSVNNPNIDRVTPLDTNNNYKNEGRPQNVAILKNKRPLASEEKPIPDPDATPFVNDIAAKNPTKLKDIL